MVVVVVVNFVGFSIVVVVEFFWVFQGDQEC